MHLEYYHIIDVSEHFKKGGTSSFDGNFVVFIFILGHRRSSSHGSSSSDIPPQPKVPQPSYPSVQNAWAAQGSKESIDRNHGDLRLGQQPYPESYYCEFPRLNVVGCDGVTHRIWRIYYCVPSALEYITIDSLGSPREKEERERAREGKGGSIFRHTHMTFFLAQVQVCYSIAV